MKMKYSELKERHAILMMVGKLTLPRKASVAISRNLVKFENELKIYNEQDKDIADQYAAKDEKGEFVLDKNVFTFETEEAKQNFISERKELEETEIEINIMKFKASELDRCEQVERYDILTPVQEASLAWMIDYEE